VRTTLDIRDSLLIQAKELAARERTTLTSLIEEGLALRLRPAQSHRKLKPVRVPVYRGRSGMAPGIDGRSNRALFDAMEEDS